ncbi:MAG: hypothetical protein NVSMB31_04150 [Vulcanimicrobiaceae bacterium]
MEREIRERRDQNAESQNIDKRDSEDGDQGPDHSTSQNRLMLPAMMRNRKIQLRKAVNGGKIGLEAGELL